MYNLPWLLAKFIIKTFYRYKDRGLTFKLRDLANDYDTRPREIP